MLLQQPSETLIARWLDEAGVEHYLCGKCNGLHLNVIQGQENVAESRIFIETDGLLVTTELDVRPSAVFHVLADLGPMNVNHPNLKLFLDVVDDGSPQLVVSAFFPTGQGIAQGQFNLLVSSVIRSTSEIIRECNSLKYLGTGSELTPQVALH